MRMQLIGIAVAAVLCLGGCTPPQYHTKDSYFAGAAVVTYSQTLQRDESDFVDIVFYEKGHYDISFSYTKPNSRGTGILPADRSVDVESAPREMLFKQYELPDFLRVRISRNGKSETHDFQ